MTPQTLKDLSTVEDILAQRRYELSNTETSDIDGQTVEEAALKREQNILTTLHATIKEVLGQIT